jgi:hypothetical protein
MPKIPKLPGNVRPMFGIEVSRPVSGGDKVIRFLYGGDLAMK